MYPYHAVSNSGLMALTYDIVNCQLPTDHSIGAIKHVNGLVLKYPEHVL